MVKFGLVSVALFLIDAVDVEVGSHFYHPLSGSGLFPEALLPIPGSPHTRRSEIKGEVSASAKH
jgi:hypothetical protein